MSTQKGYLQISWWCWDFKCPFKYRSDSIQQTLDAHDKDFCLELTANRLNLKKTHHFYSQVQTQVFVANAKHCDLVVWTQKDIAVVRVFPDVHFWESRLKKAQEFFHKVCLPELVGKHFSMRNVSSFLSEVHWNMYNLILTLQHLPCNNCQSAK